MASTAAENAVRNYLAALKDPASLRDDQRIAQLEKELAGADDPVDRVRLQQQLREASHPDTGTYEEDFVTHAKAWADTHGISGAAFVAEGVPAAVLRRAGFAVRGSAARRGGGRRARQRPAARSRVTGEEVRAALPNGTFTAKDVQEATGASSAVVRRALQEEVAAGNVRNLGADPDHSGPGRAPTRYER